MGPCLQCNEPDQICAVVRIGMYDVDGFPTSRLNSNWEVRWRLRTQPK
jgi:hypothetical protein